MQKHLFKIKVYSHNFSITEITTRGSQYCKDFARRYVQYQWIVQRGVLRKEPAKVYAVSNEDRSEFRFHINQLAEFKKFLIESYINETMFILEIIDDFEVEKVSFEIYEQWRPRDLQHLAIEYMEKPTPIAKLVEVQTGGGKTFTALQAISTHGMRLAIIIKPMYIDKWVADLLKTYKITKEDIIIVQGSASLKTLLILGKEKKLTAKAIIISNKTIQNWYSQYEKWGKDSISLGYECFPYELFKTIGVGIRLIDEGHQDFHLNFKIDCYTHTRQSITLTATLLSNDIFTTKMYSLMFPMNDRFNSIPLNKYIKAYAVHYNFKQPDKIKTMEFGGRGYSHGALEKSVLRHVPTYQNYCSLINKVISSKFLTVKREKKKLAVFASSIAMCTKLTEYFKSKYPHLDIRRYVEDDPYENLIDADIRFTTILSGGTAHDIPDLTTVIMTIAVDSIQANVQTFGRLRALADCDTEFYYFVCDDIPKHLDYHYRKVKIFRERALSFSEIMSQTSV